MRGRVASKMKRNEKEKDYKFIFFFPASYRGTLFFLSTTLCDLLCAAYARVPADTARCSSFPLVLCVVASRCSPLFISSFPVTSCTFSAAV